MGTEWIKIGTVGKAHGLRGAFFISGRQSPPEGKVTILKIGHDIDSARIFEACQVSAQSGRTRVMTQEISNRDLLEEFKGMGIWCSRDELEVDEDELLWGDLIGCKVLDNNSTSLGEVKSVENFGASDILCIEQDSKQLMVPLVEAYFDFETCYNSDSKTLELSVPAATFSDAWS